MAKPAVGDESGDAETVYWDEPGLRGMRQEAVTSNDVSY
jgi:hypothetical protein